MIKVDSNIGSKTGWLGLKAATGYDDVAGYTYQTNGYPQDLENVGVSIENKWMYTTTGTFICERERYLPTMYIDIDFAGGQSGSAIYRYINSTGYTAQSIGVGGDSRTIAVLINNWLFDFFISVRSS